MNRLPLFFLILLAGCSKPKPEEAAKDAADMRSQIVELRTANQDLKLKLEERLLSDADRQIAVTGKILDIENKIDDLKRQIDFNEEQRATVEGNHAASIEDLDHRLEAIEYGRTAAPRRK